MKLLHGPFEAVRSGNKKIEIRLNDVKRQSVQIDDVIIFSKVEEPEVKLKVKVIEKDTYDTFQQLLSHYDNVELGFDNQETLAQKVSRLYSIYDQQDELNYGVVALKIELI